jgi:hypothetical protein
MSSDRLAVYTTVYPGVERYLATWYQSVLSQTDQDFDLWVGVDSLTHDAVTEAMKITHRAINFVSAKEGSPAEIRQHALESLIDEYSSLVFVDSDDLLYPTRVETAREALESYDVYGCALGVIDEAGSDLGITFGQLDGEPLGSLLPRYNVFGMSNTAYRSEALRRCLPLPDGCELVDWLLATRAWSQGAGMTFDEQPRMAYRQYSSNVARIVLPFTSAQVVAATKRVASHYRCALKSGRPINGSCGDALRQASERTAMFEQAIGDAGTLAEYVSQLNNKAPRYVWWWCVAHPELEHLWTN